MALFAVQESRAYDSSISVSRVVRQLRRVPAEAWLALALLIAVANIVLLMIKLPGIISVLYLNSDTASAPVIASLSGSAPAGRTITLGNYPWYEVYWFMRATLHLPAHRQIWESAPVVWTVVSYGLLVRAAWMVFGRQVALMTAVIVICVTPFQQVVFFTLDTHGPLLFHACVLLAVLVWLSARQEPPGWAQLIAIGIPVSLFTGIGVASDQLAFVAYVIPYVAAGSVGLWRYRGSPQRRVAIFAITTAALAVAGGEIATAAMRAQHLAATPLRVNFVAPKHIFSNLDIFINAFTNLGGGDFFGAPLAGANYATFVAGILTMLALAGVVFWFSGRAPRLLLHVPRAIAREIAGGVYVVFWVAVLIGVSTVFLLSSVPVDSHSARYLANAYVAVAALLPVAAHSLARPQRWLVPFGIAVFAALALYGTARESAVANTGTLPVGPPVAGEIERFVLSHGAKYGYARYWDAEALTWESQLRIEAYPVYNCEPPNRAICPFVLNVISSWYTLRPHIRTFLVVDATPPDPVIFDPAAGHPVAVADFGTVTVYVYNHDISQTMP